MKILLVQDTDWLIRNIHQHHHVGKRLCLRGHELLVIDHDVMWRTHGNGMGKLFLSRQVFDGVSKVVPDACVTVIRPGILRVPFLVYVSMLFTYRARADRPKLASLRDGVKIGLFMCRRRLLWALKSGDNICRLRT